jgi:hypothetical protein
VTGYVATASDIEWPGLYATMLAIDIDQSKMES